jgi:tetratricopeptide (TPR) repeat protein
VVFSVFAISSALCQTQFETAVRLFDGGKYNESKQLFLEVLKGDVHNAEVLYYLGTLTMNEDYDTAIEYLKTAVEVNSGIAKYHFKLGDAYGLKAQRGGLFGKLGAATNCKEQYLLATSLDTKLTEARLHLIEFYLQAPGIVGGSEQKALAQADTIKMYDPYEGYLAEARIRDYQKEKAQQEECFRKAIVVNPNRIDAYRALWLIAMNENDATKADAIFKKALAAVDNKSDLFLQAGLYYVEKNDFTKARGMFDEAIKKNPKNDAVYYQYGKLALISGTDLYQGLAFFEKFFQMPHSKNSPGTEYAFWRMGMIYEKLGKTDSARISYRKSLELSPNFENAKKALEKLN